MKKQKSYKISCISSIFFVACSIILCFHSWCYNISKNNEKKTIIYEIDPNTEKEKIKTVIIENNIKNSLCNVDIINENDVFYIKLFMVLLVFCFMCDITNGKIIEIINNLKKIKK